MDTFKQVTDIIIKKLEEGVIPWRKTWKSKEWTPRNLISKKPYSGINRFILSLSEYESPWWMTEKQVAQKKGKIKDGEQPTLIVFWAFLPKKVVDETGKVIGKETVAVLRNHKVYNAEQCEFPKPLPSPGAEVENDIRPVDVCERIVKGMPKAPKIKKGSKGAFYRPSEDTVSMPHMKRFDTTEEFYSTLFHELTHSTGHASRLNRKGIVEFNKFGSAEYSQEELVAEMGASFLCTEAGIANESTITNSAAYIQGWLKVLKKDSRMVVFAAAQAQKAANYILARP